MAALLVEGHTNKEIGVLLAISPRTVEVHRGKVFSKLGVRNVAGLSRHFFDAAASMPTNITRARLQEALEAVTKVQDQVILVERQIRAAIEKLGT